MRRSPPPGRGAPKPASLPPEAPDNSVDSPTESISVWEALGEEYFVSSLTPGAARVLPGAATDADEFDAAAAKFAELRRYYQTLKASSPSAAAKDITLRDFLVKHFHKSRRSALCFSGGGVRSATFCLGVLHGLAN